MIKLGIDYGSIDKQVKAIVSAASQIEKGFDDVANTTVKDITHKLVEETVKRVPVDEGFLEKSIESSFRENSFLHPAEGVVYIPTNSPASDYALFMHEMIYKLGKRSQSKQNANPKVAVGRKYLERAFSENSRAFGIYIIKKFKEFIEHAK